MVGRVLFRHDPTRHKFFSVKMVVLVVVVHLVVFWSCLVVFFSPFNQDFMVFVKNFLLLVQSKIIIRVNCKLEVVKGPLRYAVLTFGVPPITGGGAMTSSKKHQI